MVSSIIMRPVFVGFMLIISCRGFILFEIFNILKVKDLAISSRANYGFRFVYFLAAYRVNRYPAAFIFLQFLLAHLAAAIIGRAVNRNRNLFLVETLVVNHADIFRFNLRQLGLFRLFR